MRTELAANAVSWLLQAAILKIKGTKTVHSRQNQGAAHSYESILGCQTLEYSEQALCTPLSLLPTESRVLVLVFTGSGL